MNVSLSMIPSATNGTSSPTTVTSLLWAIPVSAIHPDLPADMGNRPMFFAIHIVALACISLSMLGSLSVLLHHLNYPVPKAVSRWTGGMFRAYGEPAGSDQVTVAVKPSGRSGAAAGNAHHGTMGGQSKTVKAGIRRDFSSRFAFYLALADFLWSMAHSIDHLVLLVSGRFPDDATSMKLAIVVFVFFGGQQMMHFCLSLYTYIRVVRGVNFDLGSYDWRLQAFSFGSIACLVPLHLYLDSFGSAGYWCLSKAETLGGIVLMWTVSGVTLLNAIGTTSCYFRVATKLETAMQSVRDHYVEQQHRLQEYGQHNRPANYIDTARYNNIGHNSATVNVLRQVISPPSRAAMVRGELAGSSSNSAGRSGTSYSQALSNLSGTTVTPTAAPASLSRHTVVPLPPPPPPPPTMPAHHRSLVASRCLTTLIRTASIVYIPLALSAIVFSVFFTQGKIEPASCLAVVITANVSGLANSVGYWTNERLKHEFRGYYHSQGSGSSGVPQRSDVSQARGMQKNQRGVGGPGDKPRQYF